MEELGESSKEAERAAREVRKRVRSVLGDEAAPNLVDDAAVSLVGMFAGKEDQTSSGFSHAKHAEVRHHITLYIVQCCPVEFNPKTELNCVFTGLPAYSDTGCHTGNEIN